MSSYFVTACAYRKRAILQSERAARLLIDVLQHYRQRGDYLLHAFVVMPDHLHLLITPRGTTLERCVSLIKGGFSFRAKNESVLKGEIWQQGYYDRRIRDREEFVASRTYVEKNPVRRGLCTEPHQFPFSSAYQTPAAKAVVKHATETRP